MKNSTKNTIAVLMATVLAVSGCGNSNSSNSNNNTSGNSNTVSTTASTSEAITEEAKADSAAGGFDIDAYIANYTPKTELTNKGVFDYEVKINGNVLTCPISTAELAALGYETKMPYTATLKPNEVYTIGNTDSHYYVNKDGLALIVDSLVTTSEGEIEFDSSKPRDDIFFYELSINANEASNWQHDFTAEFYGGKINETTESEITDKCGKFDDKRNSSRAYYEYPDAKKPFQNSVDFFIEDNTLIKIGFSRTPDKVQQ